MSYYIIIYTYLRLYKTETGLEVHFATNYLGFFLLSNLLLTLLSTSGIIAKFTM